MNMIEYFDFWNWMPKTPIVLAETSAPEKIVTNLHMQFIMKSRSKSRFA